jgi:hypothetical protein
MKMPGFSAEASLYRQSEKFGLKDARITRTDGKTVVPARIFDISDSGIGSLISTEPVQIIEWFKKCCRGSPVIDHYGRIKFFQMVCKPEWCTP